jgi:hypothetical protein
MSDEIRATLRSLSDRDLLAEWDKTMHIEPPDYTLEGLIDAEMAQRVVVLTDSSDLLRRKINLADLRTGLYQIRREASNVNCDRWRIIHLAEQALGWCETALTP